MNPSVATRAASWRICAVSPGTPWYSRLPTPSTVIATAERQEHPGTRQRTTATAIDEADDDVGQRGPRVDVLGQDRVVESLAVGEVGLLHPVTRLVVQHDRRIVRRDRGGLPIMLACPSVESPVAPGRW